MDPSCSTAMVIYVESRDDKESINGHDKECKFLDEAATIKEIIHDIEKARKECDIQQNFIL